jgi:hypothetical protein
MPSLDPILQQFFRSVQTPQTTCVPGQIVLGGRFFLSGISGRAA